MAQEPKGVIYYKLRSNYEGDTTKNCGLLGSEVDSNFYFLRGYDIKTAYTETVDDKQYLVLQRVNGEKIKAEIAATDEEYDFVSTDGYIYVIYPDGRKEVIRDEEGNPVRFLTDKDELRVVTDGTINGDGTRKSPLGIDMAYLTGTYGPADFFADLTCTGASIDDFKEGLGCGHAIVSRENVSRFGALYTFGQAIAMNEALSQEAGGWRVPSKNDWGVLLNSVEENEADKNHNTDQCGNFGCIAGAKLKSTVLWEGKENDDDLGFTIYPVGGCFEQNNTSRRSTQYDFSGLYEVSNFWTTDELNGEAYTRKFSYGHDDVYQGTENKAARLSIRLVRDIDDAEDLSDCVEILGKYVPVILTTDGKQQWTAVNVDFTNYEGYNPEEVTVPEEWADIETDVPARQYYELVAIETEEGMEYEYAPIKEYELPSYAEPIKVDEKPEHPIALSDQFIYVDYLIHIDMTMEQKLFYNVWDGKRWHKKMMKEGESVVLLKEDADTQCGDGTKKYVTAENKGHEWRVYLNGDGKTAFDDLRDDHAEILGSIKTIREDIKELSGSVVSFSAATVSGFSSAFTEINSAEEEIDRIEAGVGLDENGNYIKPESGHTKDSTSVADAIKILDETVVKDELVVSNAINDLNDRLVEVTEKAESLEEELNRAETAVGLDDEGNHIQSTGKYTSGASTIEGEILALDGKLESVDEDVEMLKSKTLVSPDKTIIIGVGEEETETTIRVNLGENNPHIKFDENGIIYFDGDFGEFSEN